MSFAQRLTNLMQIKNVTSYRIGKDTGISNRLIDYWKKGDKMPNAENLKKLADYFGVSVDYLLGKTENPYGGFGVLDPVLPANMQGVNLDGAKLDEYQLRDMINNLSFLDKRSPIYERTKKGILSIAHSSGLSDFALDLISKSENKQKNKPSAEAEGYSEETMRLLKQIEQLSPSNRAKLSELARLFLADQDNS